MEEVSSDPPEWLVPGLLVPGMVLLVGDPKTFKTRLVLHMVAAVTRQLPFGNPKRKAARPGTAIYVGVEQSAGRIKHNYESKIVMKKLPFVGHDKRRGKVNLDFTMLKGAWHWKLDDSSGDRNFEELITDLRPTLLVIDPLVHFHGMDENDPRLVQPIVPLREKMERYGGCLLIVHHAKKPQANQQGRGGMERARGTSALWAMANGGILATKLRSGAVNLTTDFKDHPGSSWTWRPK